MRKNPTFVGVTLRRVCRIIVDIRPDNGLHRKSITHIQLCRRMWICRNVGWTDPLKVSECQVALPTAWRQDSALTILDSQKLKSCHQFPLAVASYSTPHVDIYPDSSVVTVSCLFGSTNGNPMCSWWNCLPQQDPPEKQGFRCLGELTSGVPVGGQLPARAHLATGLSLVALDIAGGGDEVCSQGRAPCEFLRAYSQTIEC